MDGLRDVHSLLALAKFLSGVGLKPYSICQSDIPHAANVEVICLGEGTVRGATVETYSPGVTGFAITALSGCPGVVIVCSEASFAYQLRV